MKYDENDRTKIYDIKRTQKGVEKENSYKDNIKIFFLYDEKDKKDIEKMKKELMNKKIIFNDIGDTDLSYNDNIDVVNSYDYLVVIVSERLLKDVELLKILFTNYQVKDYNKKILPVIVDKKLYIPENRANVIKSWQERIKKYNEDYFDGNFNGYIASELGEMQRILEMLESFLGFAISRDKKTNLSMVEKLQKYIKYESGIDILDREMKGNTIIHKYHVEAGGQVNIANDSSTINVLQIGEG